MDSIGEMFSGAGSSGGGNWMSMIPTVLNAVGKGTQYYGQQKIASGQDLQASAYEDIGQRRAYIAGIEASQHEENAVQQVASSQRTAADEQKHARLVASRALAVAAASGGGASDPTVVGIISRIAGEGTYRSMTALYEGEMAARTSRRQAEAARYGGQIAQIDAQRAAAASRGQASTTRNNANINALTDVGKSLYDKYAKDIAPNKNYEAYDSNYTFNNQAYNTDYVYNNAFDNPDNYG